MNLPILQYKEQITQSILANQITVLSSPTGSGKSTQIPQFLLPFVKRRITISQPRRVAASSLAQRVASEMGSKLGELVGYSVRFDDKTSQSTKIRFATDGVIVCEQMDLKNQIDDILVIDEAHERSVQTDVLLGLAKQLCKNDKAFRLVIMSATIDCQEFARFFDTKNIIHVQGRTFPIRHFFIEQAEKSYVEATSIAIYYMVLNAIEQEGDNDILAFLPGEREILTVCRTLGIFFEANPQVEILPLFASLPHSQQLQIFSAKQAPIRLRVIVATNVAETSITVPSVTQIVDCGLVRLKVYDPKTQISRLVTIPACKQQLQQRAGRAGRTAPGVCYHLYKYEDYELLKSVQIPEILCTDLSQIFLTLITANYKNPQDFEFMQQPQQICKRNALKRLHTMGLICLDPAGGFALTERGRNASRLPVDVEQAVCILEGLNFGWNVMLKVTRIVALLQVTENLGTGQDEGGKKLTQFRSPLGDFIMLLNLFESYESSKQKREFCEKYQVNYRALLYATDIYRYLEAILAQLFPKHDREAAPNSGVQDVNEAVMRAMLRGFVENVARDPSKCGTFETRGFLARIHPSSMFEGADLLMYKEIVQTSDLFMRICGLVKQEWLDDVQTPAK